jgi:hypothetical protein
MFSQARSTPTIDRGGFGEVIDFAKGVWLAASAFIPSLYWS